MTLIDSLEQLCRQERELLHEPFRAPPPSIQSESGQTHQKGWFERAAFYLTALRARRKKPEKSGQTKQGAYSGPYNLPPNPSAGIGANNGQWNGPPNYLLTTPAPPLPDFLDIKWPPVLPPAPNTAPTPKIAGDPNKLAQDRAYLGVSMVESGNYSAAMQYFNDAMALNHSADSIVHFGKALMYSKQGSMGMAEHEFEEGMKVSAGTDPSLPAHNDFMQLAGQLRQSFRK